jgi:predicted PurR-regulated permease PerM
MARLISLGVILGLIAVFGLLSLRVMAGFLLPLLLAAMLVVIFGPLYRWLRQALRSPDWVAAGLTTGFVLLIVLVPLALLVIRAGGDAVAMLKSPSGFTLPQMTSTPSCECWQRICLVRLPLVPQSSSSS